MYRYLSTPLRGGGPSKGAQSDYDDQWQVALIANNITDERVMTLSNSLPFSTTLTAGTGVAYYGIYDRPRNVALELTYNF